MLHFSCFGVQDRPWSIFSLTDTANRSLSLLDNTLTDVTHFTLHSRALFAGERDNVTLI